MFARPFVLLCALLSTQILLAQRPSDAQGGVPKSCSVTTPHQTSTFVPPAPYEAKPWGHELFLAGTDRLWTQLPITGIWNGGKCFGGVRGTMHTKNLVQSCRLLASALMDWLRF